jgi:4-alpha-glucanotransferase
MIDSTYLLHSPAGKQWQKIGIKHHHGLNIPLFSLHSDKSNGIGEYMDLIPIIQWCHSMGLDIIQLLPLNDTGLGNSPYSAISAFALNPIYLSLHYLPYLENYPHLVDELKALPKFSTQDRIDYTKVREVKYSFLKHYYREVRLTIVSSEAYKTFSTDASAWLLGYAVFITLKIHFNWAKWEEWPQEYQNPTPELLAKVAQEFPEEVEWQAVTQYLCDLQLREVKSYADFNQVLLMGDIPILIDRDSADVWLKRELFNLNYSAGAPPDQFSSEGQSWGFPTYNWEVIEKDNFSWWLDRIKFASRYFHIIRIDHIVGFFRIWSVPYGHPPMDGVFIPSDQNTWIDHGQRIMLMMLNGSDMLLIGEDLGVVPPAVRKCLTALGICGLRVMRWERNWDVDRQFISPQSYPIDSLTTVSTHDTETVSQWWRDQPEEAKTYADFKGWSYHPNISRDNLKEILWDSHHSNSLFHINLLNEYLSLIPGLTHPTLEEERINTPGSVNDNNWTYRFIPSVEELTTNSTLKNMMEQIIL